MHSAENGNGYVDESQKSINLDLTSLRLVATELAREHRNNGNLAVRWTWLADRSGDFDTDDVAVLWEMRCKEEALKADLATLQELGLIEYYQATGRCRLTEIMKTAALQLFSD